MAEQVNRPHRKPKEKKKPTPGSFNPKAHAFSGPGRLQRQAARSHDLREKRLHVPLVDRLPEEAPPLIVGVVGPPQVGKTTLIKSLIRRYTKQTLSAPVGPLTVVTSKRRRLTFIECPADSLTSMIDVAKVVDIVLLMIDGKYGFEMETMEFLNVLSASGMPGNIFGILTHLDLFKKHDTLRMQKKRLKHRFWSELYQGAKLFYLSGIVNGRYPDREVLNISRFLSVMKNPRPLVWRNSHPYCLADRFLDITPPTEIEENPKCDRKIALYGYLRGTNLAAEDASIHVPGLGDLRVSYVEGLPDPCPTPFQTKAMENISGKPSRKRLNEKERIIYAPMSDVGGVLVDKDAVYIDVKTSTFDKDKDLQELGLGEQLVVGLQGERRLLGDNNTNIRLFEDDVNDGRLVHERRRPAGLSNGHRELDENGGNQIYFDSDSDIDETNDSNAAGSQPSQFGFEDENAEEQANGHQEPTFADSDSEVESEAELDEIASDIEESDEEEGISDGLGNLRWKERLAEKAKLSHGSKISRRTADLSRLLYDDSLAPADVILAWNGQADEENDADDEENFLRQKSSHVAGPDAEDRMTPLFDYNALQEKWSQSANMQSLIHRFSTTRVSSRHADGDGEGGLDDEESELGSDEGDGEFEDLETGESRPAAEPIKQILSLEAEREANALKKERRKEELALRFEAEDREGFANDKSNSRRIGAADNENFGEDEWYDAEKAKIQKQLDINRTVFEAMDPHSRVRMEGHKAGTYVRLVIDNVPYEFSAHFNPRYPIIVGGLSATEERFGYVQVRIKRHRWHQKILKTGDPLIFSLGWRRFQTLPVYSISDSRTRNRMLKYTPEHMHCFGSFYGPLIAPNTGFCCVQSFSNKSSGFRVAASGVVLNVDASTEIVKKLKLKGHPHKVYKNTAIIRDMFGSELEIAKFKAANLRTVSGIRGMVKGRAGNRYPQGYVRAGFEDKVLMSDIVFLSTWALVKPQEFYMPVTNLLVPPVKTEDEEQTWTGMRLTSEIRRDEGLKAPQIKDSAYRPIERPERHFNPLRIPRKLAAELPFKSQIAQMRPQKKETYVQKRAVVLGGEEKRARDLMQKLTTLHNEKVAKRRLAQEKRKEPYRKRVANDLEKKAAREKREKQEYWEREGKKRKHDGESGGVARKRQRT